MTEQTIRKKI